MTKTCGGGLCSQIYTRNHGYDVKETLAQGTFFLLATRLTCFTGSQTYVDWAAQAYGETKLIDERFAVLFAANATRNYSEVDSTEVSAPAAFIAYGCAILANIFQPTDPSCP
ncbi:hypothetical protein SLS58_007304 [Diplodia intermedia]|uniref:mannan endo-1,6-alpha-mannosidase n=1 Tax=Diplodia intermedia TaxID=856260 RepID=A0ABR3TKY0_9PEZI